MNTKGIGLGLVIASDWCASAQIPTGTRARIRTHSRIQFVRIAALYPILIMELSDPHDGGWR